MKGLKVMKSLKQNRRH